MIRIYKHKLIILFILFASTHVFGQSVDSAIQDAVVNSKNESVYNEPPELNEINDFSGPDQIMVSNLEYSSGVIVLTFTFLVLVILSILMFFSKIDNDKGFLSFSIALIIGSSLYLITAGYQAEQIAPVTGLLGTIAGYLLGNSTINKK